MDLFFKQLLVMAFVLLSQFGYSQIQIVEISDNGYVEMINSGSSTVDVSDYWLCNRPAYDRFSSLTLECGQLNLAPGASLTLSGFGLSSAGDELGIYINSSFGSSAALDDYVIWGNRGGSTREGVAVAAGLWNTGDRAPAIPSSMSLNRDLSLNGVQAYSTGSSTICPTTPPTCNVSGGSITLADGTTSTTICVDGNPDPLDVIFSQSPSGSSQGFIITDDSGDILALPTTPPFDLDGAGVGICFIYAVSYESGFGGAVLGNNLADLAGCFDLSNSITVYRESPDGGSLSLVNGNNSFAQCAGQIVFDVTHSTNAPNLSYWYIITDDNDIILDWVNSANSNTIDLSNAPVGVCRVWGWSYRGLDDPIIGDPLSTLTDDSCEDVSDDFITVYREEPDGGSLSLTNGSTSFAQCAGQIEFSVMHTTSAPNLSYWYIITDENNTILDWVNSANSNTINLSAAPVGVCRVWGWSYRGLDDPIVGAPLSTLMDDFCEDVSDSFITVFREQADGGSLSLLNGSTTFAQCAGQIEFEVMHTTSAPNLSYWYIITDENNTILDWVNSANSNTINLSAAPQGVCRVWGWSYRGLDDPIIGSPLSTLMDDFCEDISEDFITVFREVPDGGRVSLLDGSTSYTGSAGNIVFDVMHSTTAPYISYWYIITDDNNNILGWVNSANSNTVDLSVAPPGICRIWGWNYRGLDDPIIGQPLSTLRDDFCEDVSDNFIEVTRLDNGGCAAVADSLMFPDGRTSLQVCAADGEADYVRFGPFTNTVGAYQLVVTNSNGDIIALPSSPTINADGMGIGEYRVYLVAYVGPITGLALGNNISTLSGCFDVSNAFILDRIECDPDCQMPINVRYTRLADNAFSIVWDRSPDAVSYEIEFGYEGSDFRFKVPVRRGTRAVLITGRTDVILARVRSVCGVGSYSPYSEYISFQAVSNRARTSGIHSGNGQVYGDFVIVQPELKVYPNPASEFINVEFDLDLDSKLQIVDVTGREVYQYEFNSSIDSTIDISELPVGLYQLLLKSEGEILDQSKFIKTK